MYISINRARVARANKITLYKTTILYNQIIVSSILAIATPIVPLPVPTF